MFLEPAKQYNQAIIGIVTHPDKVSKAVLYDEELVIKALIREDGMDEDEAREFFDFNIIGAYVGPKTPLFLVSDDVEEMEEVYELDMDASIAHAFVGVVGGCGIEDALIFDASKLKPGDAQDNIYIVDRTIQALQDFRLAAEQSELAPQKEIKI